MTEMATRTASELLRLSVAKAACCQSLYSSSPALWPEQIATLLADTRYFSHNGSAMAVHLAAADAVNELQRLIGEDLDSVALLRQLCMTLIECPAGDVHGAVMQIVQQHIQLVAPDKLVAACQARRLMRYVDAHLGAKLTLRTLSRASGWPRHSLARTFQEHAGLTIHTYIVRARVRKAIELLLDGAKAEAAMTDVGYHNKTSFNRAFQKVTGLTPRGFLARSRNGDRGIGQPPIEPSGTI